MSEEKAGLVTPGRDKNKDAAILTPNFSGRKSRHAESGIFVGDEFHFLTRDGRPFEGETRVQFLSARGPFHFFGASARHTDPRFVVKFSALDFDGTTLQRYYPVRCLCLKPRQGTDCTSWRVKGSRSGLCQDGAVALGRLPQRGDNLDPRRLFAGRIFRGVVAVVKTGQHRDPRTRRPEELPETAWYSKIARLIAVDAGGKGQ